MSDSSQHDQEKWDQRYRNKPLQCPQPSDFVVEILPRLKPGSLLDLASGDGSSSLYLAQHHFAVTAADISAVALQRQQQFAAELGVTLSTLCVDLEEADALSGLTAFDNITLTRFCPSPTQLERIVHYLKPQGLLAISAFTRGINPRFCLSPGALKQSHPQLELIHYRNRSGEDSALDEYLFRNRA